MLNERKIFIKLTRRYAFLLFIFLNIPYLLALGLAFHSYKGMCSGFMSDYSGECNFGTYVNNEFFIASMLNIIPVPICVAFWGMAVGNYCKFMIGKSSVAIFFAIFRCNYRIGAWLDSMGYLSTFSRLNNYTLDSLFYKNSHYFGGKMISMLQFTLLH
jgi:ABC-type spermidine/putrescine transport system permease subunit II